MAITIPRIISPTPKMKSTQLEMNPNGTIQCNASMPSRQNKAKVGGVIFFNLYSPSKYDEMSIMVMDISLLLL
jgi:hypothetical protein